METWIDAFIVWARANPEGLLGLSAVPSVVAVGVALLFGGRAAEVPEEPPGEFRAPAPVPDIVAEVAPEPEFDVEPEVEAAFEPEAAGAPEPARETLASVPEAMDDAPSEPAIAESAIEPAAPVTPSRVRLRDRLRRTQEAFVGRLASALGGRSIDADVLEDLETVLFSADLGVKTAEDLLARVRLEASGKDAAAVTSTLRAAVLEKLRAVEAPEPMALSGAKPHVVLVLGVNGSGKTTTIGKLAARYVAAGNKVLLGAGDTFRAAASEQLQTWGERVGCDVIAGADGGDPSAVAFDTVKAAIARNVDVAIIDTAGRLQTKKPLMEELGKMNRVIGRDLDGAPHETLLVLDSNTGQNAISQAKLFTEVANVTGLVLTKLDGTAKGGVIIGLADEFGIPVKHVGVGESIGDLRDFEAEEFVDALFAE